MYIRVNCITLCITVAPVAMDTSIPSIDKTSSSYYAELFNKSESIVDAYTTFTTELSILLRKADLSALKLALTIKVQVALSSRNV